MKIQTEIVVTLNKVLTSELTSINQFFLHARIYKNWGFSQLNDKCYKKSILDMKQADKLIERILFLEGLPNLQQLGQLSIGEDTPEMLSCDYQFELNQRTILQQSIATCEQLQDFVSRDLLAELLEGEEEYIDWIETQQYQIEQMGIEKYLQAQL
ncbi:bacterioferritin [Thalassotalea eurytherma]|uniref:Bacterioferritin n=1 Tax=Thalassotalea eurytherma TaxID=1144278 RepID=A0ABQ6H9C0_9GAMM|nr:bacterioferritin [Thalassotalea eurytherma]GLX83372.1 bacterioferritin [Thalassotalea eurytherma]